MNEAELRLRIPTDGQGRERYWANIDKRSVSDTGGSIGFKGTAAVFNQRTRLFSMFGETVYEEIAPSAFNNTLQRSDIYLLRDHDAGRPLARTGANNLRLSTDSEGLQVEADMPSTTESRDLGTLLESGTLNKMSFGFTVKSDKWEQLDDDGSEVLRTILDVRLFEVSVVAWPAYDTTSAGLRSHAFDVLCRSLQLDPSKTLEASMDADMMQTLTAALRSTPGAVTTLESENRAETTGSDGATNRQLLRMQLVMDQLAVEHGLPRWNPNGALPGASADRAARVGVGEDDRGHHPR